MLFLFLLIAEWLFLQFLNLLPPELVYDDFIYPLQMIIGYESAESRHFSDIALQSNVKYRVVLLVLERKMQTTIYMYDIGW